MFSRTGLVVSVNGEVLKGVIGVNYSDERPSQVRIVRRIDDRVISDDYEVSSITMRMEGAKIDYRLPVICECPSYTGERIAMRLKCLGVRDNGRVYVNHPVNAGVMVLNISTFNVEHLREMAHKHNDTIFLELSEEGFGRFLDRAPEEDN